VSSQVALAPGPETRDPSAKSLSRVAVIGPSAPRQPEAWGTGNLTWKPASGPAADSARRIRPGLGPGPGTDGTQCPAVARRRANLTARESASESVRPHVTVVQVAGAAMVVRQWP
jgi:hypothetical protein